MRFPKFLFFRLIVVAAISIVAQATLSGQICPVPASASEIFHGNDIRTVISNSGSLFQGYLGLFQVPFTGPQSKNAITADGLWLGGFDDVGNLKIAAQTFARASRSDYGPGPLLSIGIVDPEQCENWDKIWMAYRNDIRLHSADWWDNGVIDDTIPSIFAWPGAGSTSFEYFNGFPMVDDPAFGAPFFDLNSNNIYEPQFGDFPRPRNVDEQPMVMAWTVFNDNSNIHTTTQGNPLRFEIQLTLFAFSCEEELLNNAIFASYTIVNRAISPIDSVYFSKWLPTGLGCTDDDAIGSYPEGNTFFIYNEDNDDGEVGQFCGPSSGYGKNPPVVSVTFLNHEMSSFMYYNNGSVGSHPNATVDPQAGAPLQFYGYMTGSWRDGTPLSEGGSGYQIAPTTLTKFAFPGDPNDSTAWSMIHSNLNFGDRRAIGSVNLGRLNPGYGTRVDMVYAFHRDTTLTNLGNVSLMYENVAKLQDMYNMRFGMACDYPSATCIDDCVYPADTDHDGRVGPKDYINTVVGLGTEGLQREGPISFLPLVADPWAKTTADGTNYKHLDCTGDGVIDHDDLDIVDIYYGSQAHWYKPDVPQYGDEIQIIPERSQMVVGENFFEVEVHFNAPDIDSLYGLVFSFEYDSDKFDEVIPVQFAPLFSGPLIKQYPGEGKNDYIMVGTDLKNRAVEDQLIAKLSFFGSYDIIFTPPVDTTFFRITDVKAVMADGTILDLHGQEVPLYLVLELTSTDDLKSNSIRIYPNPSRGRISIENHAAFDGTPFSVFSSTGKMVKRGILNGTITNVDLPLGLYYIVVHDKVTLTEKVIVID